MQAGEIQIKLTLDNGQFTVETQKAGKTIQELKRSLDQTAQSSKALEQHFTGLYQKFHDTVRTASLLRFALQDIHDLFLTMPTGIVKTAAEFERMSVLMEGMSTQAGESAKKLDALSSKNYIIKMALETPFDMKALTDSFVKFKSAGLDPTDGSMKGLVESVAKFGGTSETLHRASIAIQQMAGKGVISMEELRQQLGEAVPTAMATMARGAGVSMQELSAKVKTGTVEANNALKTMFTAMQIENFGASQKLMETWDGMLSQLKTRFQLFQLDVADAGFFDEIKKQLQDVIDVLGSPGAKAFAADFGRDLASIVTGIREVIDWVIKWKDEIKTIGLLMVGIFAGNKIAGMVDNFKQSGVMTAYKQGMEEVIAAAKKEADVINLKKLQNEQLVADAEKAYAEELRLARQAQVDRVAQYEADIAAAKLHVEALRIQQQTELNNARDFNAQRIALQTQAGGLDMRLDANRVRARSLNEEAGAARVASEAASAHAAAVSREINTTVDSIAALEKKRAALASTTVANTAYAESLRQSITHMQETVTTLGNQAKAINDVAYGTKALHGVLGAGKAVWDAFGGWIGVTIGVLTVLGEKLMEYMNRWERFRQIVEDTKKGIASEEKAADLKKRSEELDRQIRDKQLELAQMKGDSRDDYMLDPASGLSMQVGTTTRAELTTQLNALLAARRTAGDSYTEQLKLIEENAASLRVSAQKRIINREVSAVFDAWKGANDQLEKDKLKALEDAQAGGKALTQSERKKIEEPFNKQAVQNQINATKSGMLLIDNLIEATKADLEKASIEEDTRKSLTAKLTALNDDKLGMRKELQRLAEDAEKYLGKGLKITKKDAPEKAEDPLIRYVQGLEAQVAEAKLRLKSNVNEIRDAASLRNEAVVNVLGDLAKGSFDKSLGKDMDEVQRREYLGGKEDRKKSIKAFIDTLADGKADVEGFVKGLNGMDEAQKKLILSAIDYKAQLPMLGEQLKALQDIQQQNKRSEEALAAARYEHANGGLIKESAETMALNKHLATLQEKFKGATKEYAEFLKLRASAMANVAMTNAEKFATDADKAVREQMAASIKATQTVAQAREYEHQENLRRIKEEEEHYSAALWRMMADDNLSKAQKEAVIAEIAAVEDAANAKRMTENERFRIASMTQLENLRKQWADSVNAMNQLSANWANTFMDNLVNVISGTKVDWKNMVSGMAKDLLGVLVKNQLGDMVTGMFGSLGGTLTSALGLGGGAGGKAERGTMTNPMIVKDVSMGGEDMFKDVKNELSDTWDSLKDKAGEMFDDLSQNFGSMFDDLGGALSQIFSSISSGEGGGFMDFASSFFADGGIMTSAGKVNAYATGGVATSPQVALFGEGSTPEAYVPLPDGRSIPVTMTNANTTNTGGVVINIAVSNNGEKTDSSGGDAETWKRVAQKVRGVVMEELVVQQRPGGVLYK